MVGADEFVYQTTNPATGDLGSTRPCISDAEVGTLIGNAVSAGALWASEDIAVRSAILRRVAELYRERRDALADLAVTEMGKPIGQARSEVDFVADIYDYYASEAPRLLADREIPVLSGSGRAVLRSCAVGAVLGIMPWNFPYYQIARFAAPSLMVGNCVLLKPAPQCPDSSLAVQEVFADAGLPLSVYSTLFVRNDQVASVIAHPGVRGVSFTGSSGGGAAVAATAGHHLKKVVLELGGSDPFVVLDDADLDSAVAAAVASRLDNNGQACNAAKRFIVVGNAYDDFVTRLVAAMSRVRVGNPRDPGTELGPLSSVAAAERLEQQIKDAVADGATVLLGGRRDGAFVEPTVVVDVVPASRAYTEEFFGPVAVVYRASDDANAVEVANDTPFGLGSYVFSGDDKRAQAVADGIDAGMVYVNGVFMEGPELPFGGTRASGFGRELGPIGIGEFLNVKLLRTSASLNQAVVA